MAIGTLSTVGAAGSNMVPFFWSDFLRENLFPNMYFRSLGTKVVVPQGYGNTIKIPRWHTQVRPHATLVGYTAVSSTAVVAAMTEGAAVAVTNNLPPESISGFITGWAGAYGYSDRVVLVSMADYVAGAVKELGRQLAGKIDEYTRAKISASAFLRTHAASNKALTISTVLKGTNLCTLGPAFEARNVPTWEDNSYVAMINPVAKIDIFKDISSNGYIPIHTYQNSQMIYRGELGSMYGVRFISTTQIPRIVGTAGTSATNYISPGATGSNMYVFAPDSFYAAEQAQGGFEVIHHPPGSAGALDSANTFGSIAVKAYYGVVPAPTTDYRLMRYAHGCSVLGANI
jgi:N4-gp56 family major capsid protein